MLNSPSCHSDMPGLLGQELVDPGGVTLLAMTVMSRYCHHKVPWPLVWSPTSQHQPHRVLLATSQASHQLHLVDWLAVPG